MIDKIVRIDKINEVDKYKNRITICFLASLQRGGPA